MPDWLPVALIGVYLTLTFGAPLMFNTPALLLRRPTLLLWGWLSTLVISVICLLAALMMFIWRSVDRNIGANDINEWWWTLSDVLLGWLSVAVLGLLIFRVGAAAAELRAQRRGRDAQLQVLHASAVEADVEGMPAYIIESPERFIGVLSTSQRVMYSSGLASALTPLQLAAAVRHEIEHVRGFHDAIRGIGALAVATAPSFPASNSLARAARIATELIADDAAAAEFGAATTSAALAAAYPESEMTRERIDRLSAQSI